MAQEKLITMTEKELSGFRAYLCCREIIRGSSNNDQ